MGHLLFLREGSLMAQPFDSGTLQRAGEVFSVAEGLSFGPFSYLALVSVSDDGVLLFVTGHFAVNQIAWFDRDGKQRSSLGDPGPVEGPAISPDENGSRSGVTQQMETAISGCAIWLAGRTPASRPTPPSTWDPCGLPKVTASSSARIEREKRGPLPKVGQRIRSRGTAFGELELEDPGSMVQGWPLPGLFRERL
jgi:hypothetical protein